MAVEALDDLIDRAIVRADHGSLHMQRRRINDWSVHSYDEKLNLYQTGFGDTLRLALLVYLAD